MTGDGGESGGDVLWLNPSLPKGLKSLTLNIRYRQHVLGLHITPTCTRVSMELSDEQPIEIGSKTDVYPLKPGEVREFHL